MENLKVKLAAIARDEAAYLPEWIFHHLHMGFDEIEIYVNNTIDNSLQVLDKIGSNYPVKYKVADALFKRSTGDFQFRAYREIANSAKKDGFDYILFLDIDEFWTSDDLNQSVKQIISHFNNPDVLCFNWALHCDESLFSHCYKPSLQLRSHNHIKTLFKTSVNWRQIGAHNIISDEVRYKSADNQEYQFSIDDPHRAIIKPNKETYRSCYIIHRMFRSEVEYISLLGRGRATASKKIKNNRFGYYIKNKDDFSIDYDEDKLRFYYLGYSKFLFENDLEVELDTAKNYINNRYVKLIERAESTENLDELKVIYRVFNNIYLDEVISVRDKVAEKLALIEIVNSHKSYNYPLRWFFYIKVARIMVDLGYYERSLSFFKKAECLLESHNKETQDVVSILSIEKALQKNKVAEQVQTNIYRDIAIDIYCRCNDKASIEFINKALIRRPHGASIQQWHEKIHKRFSNNTD